ncbi:MAG: 3-dehydroquinate synthase [Treponema sp.]|nr:3-dehydroquinate synthase [Treponema sp.]
MEKTLSINYPATHNGTEKSDLYFIEGTPDLAELFFGDEKEANDGRRRFFVTDATVASLDCMQSFIFSFEDEVRGNDVLFVLGSGEKYKTVDSVLRIVSGAVESGFTRNDVFVGIGGGVISDITAFAASIFKRGAKVQFVPTTLLSMVDAAIGGKSGCDYGNVKNIIGTFYPAEKIFFYPQFINYLPENQYNSGLAEAFKTALLFDPQMYEMFKSESEKINSRDKSLMLDIIRRCAGAKAKIVEEDFTEQGIRAHLNLGHTFGHALEAVAGFGAVTHGAAVAWGIGRAAELSYKLELCTSRYKDEILGILKSYGWDNTGSPECIQGGAIGERLVTVMHKDKKNQNDRIRIILQKDIGQTIIKEMDDRTILSVLGK